MSDNPPPVRIEVTDACIHSWARAEWNSQNAKHIAEVHKSITIGIALNIVDTADSLTGRAVGSIEIAEHIEDVTKVDSAITIGITIAKRWHNRLELTQLDDE